VVMLEQELNCIEGITIAEPFHKRKKILYFTCDR
jgi:hypothetical protein